MPSVRVYMLPDYRAGNPYQTLLSGALAERGVSVHFPAGYRRVLPLTRGVLTELPEPAATVMHLHWPDPYLRRRNGPGLLFYAAKLLADLAIARRRLRGLVWTVHNLRSHEGRAGGAEHWLYRRIAALADHVVVHSEAARRRSSEYLQVLPERMAVIPQGHYVAAYGAPVPRGEARAALGIEADRRVLLHLGMLRPYKGLEGLLRAWRSKPREGALLWLAGQALEPDYLARLRALAHGCESVRIDAGFVSDPKMRMHLCAADAAVLPFTDMLNSGGLMLAMGYGLPVLAPALDVVTETLGGDNRLLYPPASEHGLAAALDAALAGDLDDLARAMRTRAQHYNWQQMAAQIHSVYLNTGGPGTCN